MKLTRPNPCNDPAQHPTFIKYRNNAQHPHSVLNRSRVNTFTIMEYTCSECSSTFREKKNLQQHLRKDHGLEKYNCKYCNFKTNISSHLKRHERGKHSNFELKCKQCEYITNRHDNLNRHVRSKHLPKNVKCEQCEFYTDTQVNLNQHINRKHALKKCNECDFTTTSQIEMKNHKDTKHEPDDFKEKSAFNMLLYQKTWKVRGFIDPLSTLRLYKVKIANTLKHYLKTKGPMKWYIGMQVELHKITSEGAIVQEARPGFTSRPRNTLSMVDFEELYSESSNKIMKDFDNYNANGSGWIFSRVQYISIHIHCYSPFSTNDDTEDTDNEESY